MKTQKDIENKITERRIRRANKRGIKLVEFKDIEINKSEMVRG